MMTTPADSVPSDELIAQWWQQAVAIYHCGDAERETVLRTRYVAEKSAQWAFAQAAKQVRDAPDLAKLKELALVTRADVIDGAPSSWCEEYRNAWADREAGQRNKMIYRAAWQAVSAERDALIVNLESALAQGRIQGLREAVELVSILETPADVKGRVMSEMFWKGIYTLQAAIKARIRELTPCQGTNCGTTTAQHSKECIAETAIGQRWKMNNKELMQWLEDNEHCIDGVNALGYDREQLQKLLAGMKLVPEDKA